MLRMHWHFWLCQGLAFHLILLNHWPYGFTQLFHVNIKNFNEKKLSRSLCKLMNFKTHYGRNFINFHASCRLGALISKHSVYILLLFLLHSRSSTSIKTLCKNFSFSVSNKRDPNFFKLKCIFHLYFTKLSRLIIIISDRLKFLICGT